MFVCQMCNKPSIPRMPGKLIITKKRSKIYSFRQGANRPATWKEDKFERINSTNDNGGEGWETAETKRCCDSCVRAYESAQLLLGG